MNAPGPPTHSWRPHRPVPNEVNSRESAQEQSGPPRPAEIHCALSFPTAGMRIHAGSPYPARSRGALALGKLLDLQIAPDIRPLSSDEQAQDCGNQQQPRLTDRFHRGYPPRSVCVAKSARCPLPAATRPERPLPAHPSLKSSGRCLAGQTGRPPSRPITRPYSRWSAASMATSCGRRRRSGCSRSSGTIPAL